MFPVAVFRANLPGLEGSVPSSSRDLSAKRFVDAQQARQNATDHPDQSLAFTNWKFCLYLFAASSRSKPLLPIVSALLQKRRVPGGLSGYSSDQMPPKRDERSFGPLDFFRVTGTVVLPQTEIWLSATNSVEIVSRLAGDGADAKTQTGAPPISLNWSSYRSSDRDEVRIPFMWQDLQLQVPPDSSFSCRSGLAKRFFLQLQVVATLFGGYRIIIAQVKAGPIFIEDTGTYDLHYEKDVPLGGSALSYQADRSVSPTPIRAVRTPKLHGLEGVTPTVQNSPSPIASCTTWQQARKTSTSVRAHRDCRYHPYSSTAPTHIRQQSRCTALPTSHPPRTMSLPISA